MTMPRRLVELLRGPLLVASTAVLAGCGVAPERPALPAPDTSTRFSTEYPETVADETIAGPWWHRAVTGAIADAADDVLSVNPALRRAAADVEAALAAWRQAEADIGPTLNADASVGVQKASDERGHSNRSLGVDAALPIDVNGSFTARRDAARAAFDAATADAEQLRGDLARDLLLAVVDGAEARQRYALLQAQIALAERFLQLIELRFTQGLASSVDVLQQRDQLASLRQQLPVAILDARRADNQTRRIAGLTPAPLSGLSLEELPEITGRFAIVRPAMLLERRAGLRAANARLRAADARFAAALADRWPAFTLSAGGVTRAISGDVTSIVSAALDASLTLFDGDRKTAIAEQRRAELIAEAEQLLDDWIAAVIDADDLLLGEASLRERLRLSQTRLDTADDLLAAARRRFERGVSDYLPVLEALRGLQQQQRDHVALQAELARTRLRLHRALGDTVAAGER